MLDEEDVDDEDEENGVLLCSSSFGACGERRDDHCFDSTLLALQFCSSYAEVGRSFVKDLMVGIRADRMVDHHLLVLHHPRSLPYDVDHPDLLCHGSSDSVQSRELTHTVRGDKAASSMHGPGIAVGSIGSVQLVGVADPFQTFDIIDVIEKSEVEIAWNTKDAVDADLLDAGPQISTERNGIRLAVDTVGFLSVARHRGNIEDLQRY